MIIHLYEPTKSLKVFDLHRLAKAKIAFIFKILKIIDLVMKTISDVLDLIDSSDHKIKHGIFRKINDILELQRDNQSFVITYTFPNKGNISFVILKNNKPKFIKITNLKVDSTQILKILTTTNQNIGYADCTEAFELYPCGCRLDHKLEGTFDTDLNNYGIESCEVCGKYHYYNKVDHSYCQYHEQLFKKYPNIKTRLIGIPIYPSDIRSELYGVVKSGKKIDDTYLDLCEILISSRSDDISSYLLLHDIYLLIYHENKLIPSKACLNYIAKSITTPKWAEATLGLYPNELTNDTKEYLIAIAAQRKNRKLKLKIKYSIKYAAIVSLISILWLLTTPNLIIVSVIILTEVLTALLYSWIKKLKEEVKRI